MTKSRSVGSDSNQDLPPPHGLGLGGCQQGQGLMQWSNIIREEESVWVPTPRRFTLAMRLIY